MTDSVHPQRAGGPAVPPRGRVPRAGVRAVCVAVAAVAAVALSGCRSPATALTAPISVDSAYIPQPTTPGTAQVYLDIRNNGSANRLTAVHTSVGGRVAFVVEHDVRDGRPVATREPFVPLPAHTTVHMDPGGLFLLLTGAGPIRAGRDVELRLRFAHSSPVPVTAVVSNPSSNGGGSLVG